MVVLQVVSGDVLVANINAFRAAAAELKIELWAPSTELKSDNVDASIQQSAKVIAPFIVDVIARPPPGLFGTSFRTRFVTLPWGLRQLDTEPI